MNYLKYEDFLKVDIRVGTITEAEISSGLKNPSIILKIDFGENIGIKKSSAQLKSNYDINQLLDRQIAAVVNFPHKQIGNLISEVLVLGFPDEIGDPVLVVPDKKVPNGGRLY